MATLVSADETSCGKVKAAEACAVGDSDAISDVTFLHGLRSKELQNLPAKGKIFCRHIFSN
jgi:hypothetical protein